MNESNDCSHVDGMASSVLIINIIKGVNRKTGIRTGKKTGRMKNNEKSI